MIKPSSLEVPYIKSNLINTVYVLLRQVIKSVTIFGLAVYVAREIANVEMEVSATA